MLDRYLSLKQTRVRTLAEWKAYFPNALSDNPDYLATMERFSEGLRRAGMPEK